MKLLLIVIGILVVLLVTMIVFISKRYQKELRSADWYDEFQYEFESVDCPHKKAIKLSDTNWKFHFTMKKELRTTVNAGPASATVHKTRYHFYCDECGKKRWFRQTNSVRDHKGLFQLRLKYLLIMGASIMLFFMASMGLIFNVLLK
ncbi:hypothetical protein NCCP2222_24730 [Sporosarcina sp. NCCP-2222]|uniref:hypothetical protein n=1 Tax=Sporosarcina sp. NCCP-2222 TaxID=2935073 RepID=UPI0020824278|nr:hypothetical protein [Sporosarcina sp. NCCP-2222]GKV56526.1 hypothetical protein NCCP2222_24730 [Sporosarcina sp. NCCP-2222]